MTISIDEATKRITVQQVDLNFVSGTLYENDTEAMRNALNALLDDERYIWMDDYAIRNAPVTVGGVTYAQTMEMFNGWSYTYENTGMSVQLAGSNNNFFDSENGFLVNQPLVNVIGTNAAGLIQITSGSGLSALQSTQLAELYKLFGLETGVTVTITPTGIDSDDAVIDIDLTGDGIATTTMDRQ